MEIRTNNHPRDLIYWHDLTAKEQTDFDYLDTEEDREQAGFFRYKGNAYCLDGFITCPKDSEISGWHGYAGDSYFSGILIKMINDNDAVIAATYFA